MGNSLSNFAKHKSPHTHTEKEIERRTDTPNTVHSYSNSIANTYIVEQEIETVKA